MKQLLVLLMLAVNVIVFAQFGTQPETNSKKESEKAKQFGFTAEKQAPQFNGGREAMAKFIYSNMQYPADARAQGLEGDVELKFYVDTDGSIGSIEVVKGVCKSIDDEAVRVVKAMPKWIPGKNGVINAVMRTSLIIGFHLGAKK